MSDDIRDIKKYIKGAGKITQSVLGIGLTTQELINARRNICKSCDKMIIKKYLRGNELEFCSECGCIVEHKTRLKSESCPIGKW